MARILHISPMLASGGARRMAADMACQLQSMGHQNALAAPPGDLAESVAGAGIRLHTWHGGGLLAQRHEVARLARLLRGFRADAAVTYTAQAARLCRHAFRQLPADARPRLVGVVSTHPRFGEGRGWGCCEALACVSRELRDTCQKRLSFCRESPPELLPYGVDTRLCHPSYRPAPSWLATWHHEHPEAEGRFTLCIPGALSALHGLDDLPSLLNALLRAGLQPHAFLVGELRRADPVFMEQLRARLRAAGVEKHVTLLAPGDHMRELMKSCDVVLSLAHAPACYDRALLEALSLGCPVAAYDHGVAGELLDAFLPEGRVAPGDVAAMADTLTQWQSYRPTPLAEVPAPYRVEDGAAALLRLCTDATCARVQT